MERRFDHNFEMLPIEEKLGISDIRITDLDGYIRVLIKCKQEPDDVALEKLMESKGILFEIMKEKGFFGEDGKDTELLDELVVQDIELKDGTYIIHAEAKRDIDFKKTS